jgi:very-short-patch-repair endonuclease
MEELRSTLARHRGRRGTRVVGELASRYSSLPYKRTRSDAEGRALELLHDAGIQPPRVNTRIAREEADLAWPERRLIIEIDGPQYHCFPDEDARKQRAWEAADYTVRRIPSDLVYKRPELLIALASGEA